MNKIKRVMTSMLKPGELLAEGAYTDDNTLIVAAETILDDLIISKLKQYSIRSVKIYDIQSPDELDITKKFNIESPSYFERIQQSNEFSEFKKELTDSVESFKQNLNDIVVKSTSGVVDKMLDDVSTVLAKTRNPLHLMDMLQCMRGYDDLTYMHSMNVALVCNVIGTWLNMNETDLRRLTTAGLLHDIGKLKIPNEIITKPGKLTDDEFNTIRLHPQYGYDILKDKPLERDVKLAALQHHERYNGTGYPLRITGGEIEYFSSIVAIADVYDAMTSDRCYRKGMCPFEVLAQFERENEFYEPGILYLFTKRTVEAYINTEVMLSNGEKGRVILLNPSIPSKPTVITANSSHDLSKEPDLKIVALI